MNEQLRPTPSEPAREQSRPKPSARSVFGIQLTDAQPLSGIPAIWRLGAIASTLLMGALALIAALYLDGGFDAAKQFVLRYWEEQFQSLKPELRDAKTALDYAERAIKQGNSTPGSAQHRKFSHRVKRLRKKVGGKEGRLAL